MTEWSVRETFTKINGVVGSSYEMVSVTVSGWSFQTKVLLGLYFVLVTGCFVVAVYSEGYSALLKYRDTAKSYNSNDEYRSVSDACRAVTWRAAKEAIIVPWSVASGVIPYFIMVMNPAPPHLAHPPKKS